MNLFTGYVFLFVAGRSQAFEKKNPDKSGNLILISFSFGKICWERFGEWFRAALSVDLHN